MDVNAPEFVPGALSANAAEFVPMSQLAPPSLGMSAAAPEFVPGKNQEIQGLNGMPVFSMGYDMGNAGSAGASAVRGLASSQPLSTSNASFMDGRVGGAGAPLLCEVEPGAQEWASWNKDVNSVEEDVNWDPDEQGPRWNDTGPRWDSEDVVSKALHLQQAGVGMFPGSKSSTVQYMDQMHHASHQDMNDLGVASAQMAGTSHDGVHREGPSLVDVLMGGQLHPQDISQMEASDSKWRGSDGTGDAEIGGVLGTKVALDVLFPNLDRTMDGDTSKASIPLDRRHQATVTARLPGAGANDYRDWASSNHRFDCSPSLPPAFAQTKSPERPEQPETPGSLSEDALNIAESVAAMALGLDMEDESPMERRDNKVNLAEVMRAEPATASQPLAFPPPSAPSTALNGMVPLHDVLPMQDALWQPPPRIRPSAAHLQGPSASLSTGAQQTSMRSAQPPVEPPMLQQAPDGSSTTGARRLLPPPPPTEPPPPPPVELMRQHLPDQRVALHSS